MNSTLKIVLVMILLLIILVNDRAIFLIMVAGQGHFQASRIDGVDLLMPEHSGPMHHLSESDLEDHPALAEMIVQNKRVFRHTASSLDLIPGHFWGPAYASIRISAEEDAYLMQNGLIL